MDGKQGFVTGIWNGANLVGLSPLTCRMYANSGYLLWELNWIVEYPVSAGELENWCGKHTRYLVSERTKELPIKFLNKSNLFSRELYGNRLLEKRYWDVCRICLNVYRKKKGLRWPTFFRLTQYIIVLAHFIYLLLHFIFITNV